MNDDENKDEEEPKENLLENIKMHEKTYKHYENKGKLGRNEQCSEKHKKYKPKCSGLSLTISRPKNTKSI